MKHQPINKDTRYTPDNRLTSPGPFLAKVVSHLDPTYTGRLEVQLLHYSGNDDLEEGQLHTVNYLSPFAGQTSLAHVKAVDNYNETQKSYGMWMVPPDPGVIVMVIFVEGDPGKGYWIGCVQDYGMNFMMPGNAATELTSTKLTPEANSVTKKFRVPAAEYNKLVHANTKQTDVTQIKKPSSPQEVALSRQGLLEDDIRGITTSSARREVPSAVFGISTPGPIDKLSGKTGEYGKRQWRVKDKPVSRLTGSSFVMDDGDPAWERKKTPSEGPPEYANVEAGETGLRDRPHNELIRLRTRTGHQILMHNSEDLIYISNSRGTTWIELSSDGKIDIYAEDSISVRTKKDFNFTADRDFNLDVGGNFNLKVRGETHIETGGFSLLASSDGKISCKNLNLNAAENYLQGAGTAMSLSAPSISSTTPIGLGGSAPAVPLQLKPHLLPEIPPVINPEEPLPSVTKIVRRMPTREPYPHHENLDPLRFKPENTARDAAGRNGFEPSESMLAPSAAWRQYSTSQDTFKR